MSRFVLPPSFLLAPLLWLFRRALFGGEMFVYRDAAHYYFPLYHYVQSRWGSGGLPLWNPLDGIGQPLLGDPTAAVLYPGKFVFLLPLDFATCFVLYVVGHLWLAGCGTYWLARRWHAPWQGALMGGFAYELSGQVLFQYCNPIYCVGAAWLPWAVLHLDRGLVRGERRAAVSLGVVLSLMILGGDPQTAYHVLLMGVFLALLLGGRHPRRSGRTRALEALAVLRMQIRSAGTLARLPMRGRIARPTYPTKAKGTPGRFALLGLACLVMLLLSAPQVFPSLEWSRRSDRVVYDAPRTIYEWAADVPQALRPGRTLPPVSGFWARPSGDGHAATIDDFSIGPWRWIELLWPNVSGKQFPVHRRWSDGIPAEGRVWTPTLYMGLVAFLLAICRARFLRGTVRVRWLAWLAVLSALAALGTYGLAWLVEEIRFHLQGAAFQPSQVSPRCGGLYWLMTVILPSFMTFRYPAKLWTICVLVLSLLAAKGWSSHVRGPSRLAFSRRLGGFGLLSALLAVVTACGWDTFARLTSGVPSDALFGPFEARASWRNVLVAFVQAGLVAGMAGWWIRLRRHEKYAPRWAGLLVLSLSATELTVAQRWLVQTAPVAQWRSIEASRAARHLEGPLYRCRGWRGRPSYWKLTSSWDRLARGQLWAHRSLLPKYHLLSGHRSIATVAPFANADYHVVWKVATGYGPKTAQGTPLPHLAVLNLLGASHLLVPPNDYAREAVEADPPLFKQRARGADEGRQSLRSYRSKNAMPRAWIVHDWEQWGSIPRWKSTELRRRTEAVLFPRGKPRDFAATAILEGGTAVSAQQAADGQQTATEFCRVVRDQEEAVALHVKLDRAGIVVLGDQYFPGWRAFVASRSNTVYQRKEILRVNRVMRGVPLESGEYWIYFHYQPMLLYASALLSAAAWVFLIAWTILSARRWVRRKPTRAE